MSVCALYVDNLCRCGADTASGHAANPSNCTVGPKNPFYWDQTEGNNVRLSALFQ